MIPFETLIANKKRHNKLFNIKILMISKELIVMLTVEKTQIYQFRLGKFLEARGPPVCISVNI